VTGYVITGTNNKRCVMEIVVEEEQGIQKSSSDRS
jgi:hypothetical protein